MKTVNGRIVFEDTKGGIAPHFIDRSITFMENGIKIEIPFSLVSRMYRIMEHECKSFGKEIEEYEKESL
jgi:hypothetical protein